MQFSPQVGNEERFQTDWNRCTDVYILHEH